ncbi:MAG TPA: cysteine--tRNA ligase [Solirubrobacteraceae bacterium]|jgi:cysteinyl-tRNA synthetase|nr:cysteine--tRNA ligase [Solirubrobacteraceae bacterium]
MREIRLHDTRSGEVLPLSPRDPGRAGIYACGPTVYSRIHIGNARPFVVFTLLKRFLEHEGYKVNLVVNVTDVNDKIYDAAQSQGRASAELAAEMTAHYKADTDALGLGRPDHEPLASQTIGPIVEYIQALIDRGHAYTVQGDVYFRVRSDDGYGSLSHRQLQNMDQGEGDSDPAHLAERKEDPLDFALWKSRKEGEDTYWASPWGDGRPGWHIECSAMAEQFLGVGFDIHGGGSDLLFPHHENEAAQTRAARGAELAQIWMHNGMIQLTGEKMAKSAGNIATLHEVLGEYGHETVVMYLISGHYRQPLAFSKDALEQAHANVKRIREAGRKLGPGPTRPGDPAEAGNLDRFRLAFFDALADDFNTAAALAQLNEWLRAAGSLGARGDADLREMLGVLGLCSLLEAPEQAPAEVRRMAEERMAARSLRDFAASDLLRDRIAAMGWEVRDVAGGFELLPL